MFFSSAVIKSKYYPWIMLFLLLLFGAPIIPLLSGVLVGYLFSWHMFDRCVNLSPQKAASLEGNWLFSTLRPMTGFVPASSASQSQFLSLSQPQTQAYQPQQQESARAANLEPVAVPVPRPAAAFFTGQGVAVGGEKEEKRAVSVLVEKPSEQSQSVVKHADGASGQYDIVRPSAVIIWIAGLDGRRRGERKQGGKAVNRGRADSEEGEGR